MWSYFQSIVQYSRSRPNNNNHDSAISLEYLLVSYNIYKFILELNGYGALINELLYNNRSRDKQKGGYVISSLNDIRRGLCIRAGDIDLKVVLCDK
jgi:hypothetical protein